MLSSQLCPGRGGFTSLDRHSSSRRRADSWATKASSRAKGRPQGIAGLPVGYAAPAWLE